MQSNKRGLRNWNGMKGLTGRTGRGGGKLKNELGGRGGKEVTGKQNEQK